VQLDGHRRRPDLRLLAGRRRRSAPAEHHPVARQRRDARGVPWPRRRIAELAGLRRCQGGCRAAKSQTASSRSVVRHDGVRLQRSGTDPTLPGGGFGNGACKPRLAKPFIESTVSRPVGSLEPRQGFSYTAELRQFRVRRGVYPVGGTSRHRLPPPRGSESARAAPLDRCFNVPAMPGGLCIRPQRSRCGCVVSRCTYRGAGGSSDTAMGTGTHGAPPRGGNPDQVGRRVTSVPARAASISSRCSPRWWARTGFSGLLASIFATSSGDRDATSSSVSSAMRKATSAAWRGGMAWISGRVESLILWGSETPSSSIPDLSAACPSFWPQGPSPKSCSNACSNPGGTHRHVAAPGGLKPRPT
jgi:hypothetical protein